MLDTWLTLDEWESVLDFLSIKDIPKLLILNKKIHTLLDTERTYKRFARRHFPENTLNLSGKYNGSWKALLADNNAENGVYVTTMNIVSYWRYNSSQQFYVNAIRFMVWDRKNHSIAVIIEAFGESDLRAAHTTTIFRVIDDEHGSRGEIILPRKVVYRKTNNRETAFRAVLDQERGRGHDIVMLLFEESQFKYGYTYKFTYNGSRSIRGRDSDYRCTKFIDCRDFRSLSQWFDTTRVPSRHDSVRPCEFIQRIDIPKLMETSNVMEWPADIPDRICELYRQGEWGVAGGSGQGLRA